MIYYVPNFNKAKINHVSFVHANLNITILNFPYWGDASICCKDSIFLHIKDMPDETLGDGCNPNWFIGLHLNDGKILAIPYASVKRLK